MNEGTAEFAIVPAPGSMLTAGPDDPIEAVIVEVPRFVEETWQLLRNHPSETRRDVFLRCGREVERGPVGEVVTRTRYGVHRPTEEPNDPT